MSVHSRAGDVPITFVRSPVREPGDIGRSPALLFGCPPERCVCELHCSAAPATSAKGSHCGLPGIRTTRSSSAREGSREGSRRGRGIRRRTRGARCRRRYQGLRQRDGGRSSRRRHPQRPAVLRRRHRRSGRRQSRRGDGPRNPWVGMQGDEDGLHYHPPSAGSVTELVAGRAPTKCRLSARSTTSRPTRCRTSTTTSGSTRSSSPMTRTPQQPSCRSRTRSTACARSRPGRWPTRPKSRACHAAGHQHREVQRGDARRRREVALETASAEATRAKSTGVVPIGVLEE